MAMRPANKRFFIVICAIVALLTSWWVWDYFSPKPLGDKLEYIGRTDYGSWLPLSSSSPTGVYYYATDMSIGEVGRYFKKATMTDTTSNLPNASSYDRQYLSYKNRETGQTFLASYVTEGQKIQKENPIRKSSKEHIFIIDSTYSTDNYGKARSSL